MRRCNRLTRFALVGWILLTYGCATAPPPQPRSEPLPEPSNAEIVKVRVVVAPEVSKKIPAGARIVITNFDGPCALEVQDALMRRLVDNADYDVLTREHLRQILVESEQSWTGKFDSTTATRLGDLLGASLFAVGRIAYCGPSREPIEDGGDESFSILAVLQILDLRTGKVLVSSAGEGVYVKNSSRLMKVEDTTDVIKGIDIAVSSGEGIVSAKSNGSTNVAKKTASWVGQRLQNLVGTPASGNSSSGFKERSPRLLNPFQKEQRSSGHDGEQEKDKKQEEKDRPVDFVAFKTAEDLANKFANKFFARPSWEDVEMWTSPEWTYGDSIQFVKLGHCQQAVDLLQGRARQELGAMPDLDVARYLHNLGVAYLCNNEAERAMKKLRSAYRLTYDPTTLEMLELTSKIVEWSLTVEVDSETEVGMLVSRALSTE